jgi:hypothetical protein
MAKLLHFERVILDAVSKSLSGGFQSKFLEQVAHINKVQRLLDWNEVEFYCMRWFKVHWPVGVLFQDHHEFQLASGILRSEGVSAAVRVMVVGGHVFSLESDKPMKPFHAMPDVSFVVADSVQPFAPADGYAAR